MMLAISNQVCLSLIRTGVRVYSTITKRVVPVYRSKETNCWHLFDKHKLHIEEIKIEKWKPIKGILFQEGRGLKEVKVFQSKNGSGFIPLEEL